LIGASLGSVVCGVEAAKYGDLDGVVLTAYMPVDGGGDLSEELLRAMFEPAVRRKRHLAGLVDDDYLLPQGGRGSRLALPSGVGRSRHHRGRRSDVGYDHSR
jgi:hypothetical protein